MAFTRTSSTESADSSIPAPARSPRVPRAALLATAAVAGAVRLATLPKSFWEFDELLFAAGVGGFDPALHRPHPPGYPLLIGLGKLFTAFSLSPFQALLALAVVSSAIGAPALAASFGRLARPLGERHAWQAGVAGALLFELSAAMLVQGALPMSDPPALLFLSLALLAAGALLDRPGPGLALGLGIACSATIGCRPQMAVSVVPLLAVTLALAGRAARSAQRAGQLLGAAIAGFAAMSLVWFLPLVLSLGGPSGLYKYETGHATAIANSDWQTWHQGWTSWRLLTRFTAHPWGPAWVAVPVLSLAAIGALYLLRTGRRQLWPLLTVGAIQLAFCLFAMEPADGVRYALPVALVTAGLAAVGAFAGAARLGRPSLAPMFLGALVASALLYTGPLLYQRATTLSPPAQAAAWARRELPEQTIFMVSQGLAPHAAHWLGDRFCLPLERTLNFYPELPKRSVYLFVEGSCPFGGSHSFQWAASDGFGKLTRNHYRLVSLCEMVPARRFLAVRGVSPLEIGDGLAWWWLTDDAATEVRPRGAASLRLRLRLPPEAPIAATAVSVSAAGELLGRADVARGATRDFTFRLPQNHADGRLEIELRSAGSFVPADDGLSRDRRRLAVQLLELELLYEDGAAR